MDLCSIHVEEERGRNRLPYFDADDDKERPLCVHKPSEVRGDIQGIPEDLDFSPRHPVGPIGYRLIKSSAYDAVYGFAAADLKGDSLIVSFFFTLSKEPGSRSLSYEV